MNILVKREDLQRGHIYFSPLQQEYNLDEIKPFLFLRFLVYHEQYEILTEKGIERRWLAKNRQFKEIL